ncbi:MAG: PIN domain-containing protein, partial [Candidatus Woesearchaeota archaeon]
MRVVLDTNILISGLLWRGYPYNAVIEGIKGSYQLLLSLEILDELRDKLLYKLGFPAAQTDEYIT